MSKKKILNIVAKVGIRTATDAGGTASMYGLYQPAEPKALQQLRNKK
jgi:cyclic lactone autoinducer peptide